MIIQITNIILLSGKEALMINMAISDTKGFVRKLLMEEVFDTFLLVEANVKSNVSYHISGRINKDFFDNDELAEMVSTEYTVWHTVRPHIFNVIKGKKQPLSFKIVFILSNPNIERIIEKNNLPLSVDDIANLALNIYFDGNNMTATTIASLKSFSLDKTLENLWDKNILAFFKHNEMPVEIV